MVVGPARRPAVSRRSGRGTWAAVPAVLLGTHTMLSALRLFFPGAYGLSERSGTVRTALVVAAVLAAGLLVPLGRRVIGAARAPIAAVGALAAWRLAVQLWPDVPLALAAAGVALAGATLALLLGGPWPAQDKVNGFFGGLLLDVVIMSSFLTWDPAWQRTAIADVVGLAIAAGTALAAVLLARVPVPEPPTPRALAMPTGIGAAAAVAVGGVLCLEVLFLANPAFLAAAGSVSSSWAAALGLLAVSTAIAAQAALPRPPAAASIGAAAVLAVAGYLLPAAHGATAVAVVLAGQAAVGLVIARAAAPTPAGATRVEVAFAAAWCFPVVGTLLYQLHYDTALPVSNRWLTALAGAAGALALLTPRPPAPERRRLPTSRPVSLRSVGLTGVLLTALLGLTAPQSPATPAATRTTLRVVQWNVHQAVDANGQLDPLGLERNLDAVGPIDLLVLNEVGRGWPLSGQLDLAAWLSRRLDLPFVWGGAASASFGNLVLSRLPVTASEVVRLPSIAGAQGRSLIDLTLDRGGTTVHVLATHLQHRNDERSMQARMEDITVLVARTGGEPTILAGDLNPKQGDPPTYPPRRPDQFAEIRALLDVGYTTAADLTACGSPTSGRNCSDYVLVHGAVRQASYAVAPDAVGDHHLVVTDIAIP